MKYKLFQSIFPPLPLACFLRNPSPTGERLQTVCNLCTFLIKTTWGHSVFMSWMMEIGLSDTITHLCWQGGRGEEDGREGSSVGRRVYLFPQRETATRSFCKNMQRLQCFLLAALQPSSLPFQMWLLLPFFPRGLSGWQSILFFGWLVVIASDLVSS